MMLLCASIAFLVAACLAYHFGYQDGRRDGAWEAFEAIETWHRPR